MNAWMINVLLGFCVLCWPATGGAEGWRHSAPQWHTLSRGLSFTETQVWLNEEPVEQLAVVKIDPHANYFRVFHHAPQSIVDWQKELGATVVFNASYFCPGGKPCGLIIADGRPLGPLKNPQMRGMFVAEPKGMSPDLPRATILDLRLNPVTLSNFPWNQGVQSYPLLLDYKGRIRVASSRKTAQRTVVAADRNSNILVFNTRQSYFTLYQLARFLKTSAFEIDSALNLDGGTEAQLFIKSGEFEYFSPPGWHSAMYDLLTHQKFWLTTVIGVFPRQE